MPEHSETVIVGAGQAGLALSRCLAQRGRPHVVVEQAAQVGSTWRTARWDSFTLVSPNWTIRLPGAPYAGPEPEGFMDRDAWVAYLERYAAEGALPIRFNTRVTEVTPLPLGGYAVSTADEAPAYLCQNVVIATGFFQRPRRPDFSAALPADLLQLDASAYRNPDQLPAGAVLVVGSGQSGCQITEELYQRGRTVYLSVGGAGRAPRRYRGRDVFDWLNALGFFLRTADKLPRPEARFAANPQVSGKAGGHALNLHQFARDGVHLLGRAAGFSDGRLQLAPDLHEQLARADQVEAEIVKAIDGYIAESGINAPLETLLQLRAGFDVPLRTELDLAAAGIRTVIWAAGFRWDFSLVRLPIFEPNGYPIQTRGVTEYPGLYFLGLPFLHNQKSSLLLGVGDDAEYLAELIAARASAAPLPAGVDA